MSENRERLRRLLLLVPTVARKQGLTLTELAKRLGVERAELLEDLDLLTMVGRPPFSPDDFIDIYVEGERVHVALDQRFSRPPRLTAVEAAALWASAQSLRPAARSALGSAQKKLFAAVPRASQKMFEGLAGRVGAESAPMDDLLEPLARAARELREVEFDYLAAGRKKGERRSVRPYAVYQHRGQWYLSGFDLGRKDDRLFRVDRVSALVLTERRFSGTKDVRPPTGFGTGSAKARIRFTKEAAPWARERFGDSARSCADGGLEVEIEGATPEWLVPFVLGYAGEAQVIEPPELREAVRKATRQAIAAY